MSVKSPNFSSLLRDVLGSAPSRELGVTAETAGDQSLIQQALTKYLLLARYCARHEGPATHKKAPVSTFQSFHQGP